MFLMAMDTTRLLTHRYRLHRHLQNNRTFRRVTDGLTDLFLLSPILDVLRGGPYLEEPIVELMAMTCPSANQKRAFEFWSNKHLSRMACRFINDRTEPMREPASDEIQKYMRVLTNEIVPRLDIGCGVA